MEQKQRQKIIQLYKSLGSNLIFQGQLFLRKAFHVKFTQTITSSYLKSFLTNLGIPRINIYCADRKYMVIDLEVMKDIIAFSWTDKEKYLVDNYDCDDFALAFKSHLAEIYKVNSIALSKGVKVYIPSKDKTSYHRCNLFLATDKGVLKAYVYEAQNDGYQQLEKDVPIKIGSWTYQLSRFEF